jgi:CheY-like chemotaxis protein
MDVESIAESKAEWARKLVRRQVKHLVRLIDDLLDVSRVTNGRVQLKREVIDLRQVVNDSIDSIRAQIEDRRHALDVQLASTPIYVDGDAVRLGQVFGNLLINAANYMEPGGRISVSADLDSDDPSRAVVCVIDTGWGLDRGMLEHVFELFAQARPAGGRPHSGLGIGLALVRKLVELHDGRVRAESKGPGKGSQFSVDLPITAAIPSLLVAPTRRYDAAAPLRLLVVDDNADAAATLAHLLEQLTNHEIRVVHDGIAGVEAAIAFRPDVVFLDIGLPDINGYEVARRLRERSELGHTRLVAITGFGAEQSRALSSGDHLDRFLAKPIAFTDLEAVLSEVT